MEERDEEGVDEVDSGGKGTKSFLVLALQKKVYDKFWRSEERRSGEEGGERREVVVKKRVKLENVPSLKEGDKWLKVLTVTSFFFDGKRINLTLF